MLVYGQLRDLQRLREPFAGIESAKDIFNGFALFLAGNTAEHFSVGGARTQSIDSNLSIRELRTHGSRQTWRRQRSKWMQAK